MATLMIVEDDRNQRRLYEQELIEAGYDVILAKSGQEALDKLEKLTPALIILDIAMPGMDGVETLGRILNRRKSIPVILNTAYSDYKDNFVTWSADAYVVKSWDMSELMSKIEELLSREADDYGRGCY